jgi:hypothetical protein
LISDVTDDEGGAIRYRPIETGREVVEHHDALAGIDERMNHVASDIAGAAGDLDRHAGGPLLSPGVAGSDVGNVRLGACIPESIVKRAKAPRSSGSGVRKLIYSDVDQARQCWRQAPSNPYRRRH